MSVSQEQVELYVQAVYYLLNQNLSLTPPSGFSNQVRECRNIVDNDVSGLITTIIDFVGDAVGEIKWRIETDNENITKTFNKWLSSVNQNKNKYMPSGFRAFCKQYVRESFISSFIITKYKFGAFSNLRLPINLWIIDPYYVKSEGENNNLEFKYTIEDEEIKNAFIRKEGAWYEDYPVPFLIKRGVWANYTIKKRLKDKSADVLKQLLWYLFLFKRGNPAVTGYKAPDFDTIGDNLKSVLQDAKDSTKHQSTPAYVGDKETYAEHILPDLTKVFTTGIYEQLDKDILAGMGLVDIVQSIGSSIDENEFVLVKINKKIIQVRVKDLKFLIKNKKLEVPTFEKGKCIWKNASIWSHPYKGKMYNIISDDGQYRVKTTGNHSLMIWDKEKSDIVKKRADELKIGDNILILKNFNIKNNKYQNLFYINSFGSNQNYKKRKKISVKLDEDFAYFLGWWIAEGSCSKYAIHLSVGTDLNEAEKVLKIGEKIFKKKGYLYPIKNKNLKYRTLYEVRFNSKGISDLFKEVGNTGALNKKVPQEIFNSPKPVQEAFLRGLLEGDGYFYKKRKTWELTTASEELAYDVVTLGRMLNKIPHINVRNRKIFLKKGLTNRKYYLIYFAKKEGLLSSLLPKLKIFRNGYIENIKEYNNKLSLLPKDWLIKKINKINVYNYNGEVYDLEVKDNETFVAGTNILVHNTRREAILNPKPLVQKTTDIVLNIEALLYDIIKEIIIQNAKIHRKTIQELKKVRIIRTPLKAFWTQDFKEFVKSLYDRGLISYATVLESNGFDLETEVKRREKEAKDGLETILYPPVTFNREGAGIDIKDDIDGIDDIEKEEETTEDKKGIEKRNYLLSKFLETAPYKKIEDLPDRVKNNMSKTLQETFLIVVNKALIKYKDDTKAFKTAWSVIKKIAKKGKNGKWIKKSKQTLDKSNIDDTYTVNDLFEEIMDVKKLEIANKKAKLIDHFLEENKEQ